MPPASSGSSLGLLDDDLAARFHAEKEVDFSFSWREEIRFRANVFRQQGSTALALRAIPFDIPTFDELGLPPIMEYFAGLPQGLLLVTGPTGSGKSTTQASVIDFINHTRECHILTIEDPIEYVHTHRRSAVNQREVGVDTDSFERALRSALREDPDVMLVGEMRDAETMQFALTIAETGHLVFATLHTNDAATALDRIVDVFPADRQAQIRVQLAAALVRRGEPAAHPAHRRRHGRGVRGDRGHQPDPQPDPRRQDPPAPQHRRHQHARRHADDGGLAQRIDRSRRHQLRGRGRPQPVPQGDQAAELGRPANARLISR